MTTKRALLTDALIREALQDLAAGPDAGALTSDVLRHVDGTSQARGLPWPAFQGHRRTVLVGLAALLVVGLVGALIAAGSFRRTLLVPAGPPSLVVQQWNGQRDPASRVTHLLFTPGAVVGTQLNGLPPNAVGLRWSPDGARLAYFERDAPPNFYSVPLSTLFLANRDGSHPVPVTLPRPVAEYASNGFWAGVQWAPAGNRFLLPWSKYSCTGGVNCIPPGGIDVFDITGTAVALIPTPENVGIQAWWSPDGLAVGWASGTCGDSNCTTDAFHWRRVVGDAAVTTLPIESIGQVVWARDGLHVVKMNGAGATGAYTMATDGSNVRETSWAIRPTEDGLGWSPDGRFLAAVDRTTWTLRVRDVQTGAEFLVSVPPGFAIAGWAPDSSRLVLDGNPSSNHQGYGLAVIAVDGTGLVSVGDGEDFGWLPGQ